MVSSVDRLRSPDRASVAGGVTAGSFRAKTRDLTVPTELTTVKRALIHTFGCQMNVHDSRRIEEVLRGQGYGLAERPEDADLVVFNTCSVREKADHKLYSAVGTLRALKERNRELVIAVSGCLAQQQGDALLSRLPLVDVVVGPDNLADLPELVRHVEDGGPPVAKTEFDLVAPTFLRATASKQHREVAAYVTVMKGCDERCTYCIVPYTRGSERYRPAQDIIDEIAALVAGGVREITLLGQTVNSWHEPGELPGDARRDESRFAALLYRIAEEVPELLRLRYTSPHPRHVTEALVTAHRELSMLPAHVHLPVQSGSDRMLRRMLRRYRRDEFIERARLLQSARPGFTLSTDIIVGFPDETAEDFELTLSLVREVGFVGAFGFKYSPRPHTPALRFEDDVAEPLKAERLARLFEVTEGLQQAHLQRLVGSSTRVLFEGRSRGSASTPAGYDRFMGRSERNEIVHVDVPRGADPTGLCLAVRVEEANRHSLLASLLEPLPEHALTAGRTPLRLPVVS